MALWRLPSYVALGLYAVHTDTNPPEEIVEALQDMKTLYTKHENTTSRVVASMVSSAVSSKTNRSMDDPLLLAKVRSSTGTAWQALPSER